MGQGWTHLYKCPWSIASKHVAMAWSVQPSSQWLRCRLVGVLRLVAIELKWDKTRHPFLTRYLQMWMRWQPQSHGLDSTSTQLSLRLNESSPVPFKLANGLSFQGPQIYQYMDPFSYQPISAVFNIVMYNVFKSFLLKKYIKIFFLTSKINTLKLLKNNNKNTNSIFFKINIILKKYN